MNKRKGSKPRTSRSAASLEFDESIKRVPTEYGLSIYSDKSMDSHGGASGKDASILTGYSQKIFYSDMRSMNEHDSTGNRLTTDRFRVAHSRKNNATQEGYGEQLPRIEYVDLNGRLLDPEKLRNSNMLPGQHKTRAALEYASPQPICPSPVSPPLQPKNSCYRAPSSPPYMPTYTLEEPYSQRNCKEQLEYADNIGQIIQEKYAVLPSELTPVKTVLIPVSPSHWQSVHEPQRRPSGSEINLSLNSQDCDTYANTAELPSSYRVVERRGCTLVSDLLLNPVTGAPAPLQIIDDHHE